MSMSVMVAVVEHDRKTMGSVNFCIINNMLKMKDVDSSETVAGGKLTATRMILYKRGCGFIAPTLVVTIVTMKLNGLGALQCWECLYSEDKPSRDCLYPTNFTTTIVKRICDMSKGYTACAKGIGNFKLKLNYAPVINGTSPENITIQIANVTSRFCAKWELPQSKSKLETYEVHKGDENLTDIGEFDLRTLLTFFPPNTDALIRNMTISTELTFVGATLKCNASDLCNDWPGRFIRREHNHGSRNSVSLLLILALSFKKSLEVVSFNFLRSVMEHLDNILFACQMQRISLK